MTIEEARAKSNKDLNERLNFFHFTHDGTWPPRDHSHVAKTQPYIPMSTSLFGRPGPGLTKRELIMQEE